MPIMDVRQSAHCAMTGCENDAVVGIGRQVSGPVPTWVCIEHYSEYLADAGKLIERLSEGR